MFKKPFADIKTFAPLRSSDRRKFKARTTERFQLAAEIADMLVPDGLLVRKFRAHNGTPGVPYVSVDGDPLWFGSGKDSGSSFDELTPTVYTLRKYPTLLPVLTTSAAIIPVLIGGADIMVPGVVQAPSHAPAGALVSIAQFARDAWGPPLAVGRMAVDADRISNNSANKGKAVVVLHTWKDHLWSLGSRGEQPDVVPVVGAAGGVGDDGGGADRSGSGADAPRPGADQESSESAPAVTQDNAVKIEVIEKLTPEEVSTDLRAALLQALRTTLASLPNSAFPMPTTTLYMAHILPACPFLQNATTPVDIKHSTFKSLSAFLCASEKDGLLKLKHAQPEVQVAVVFPRHADVITHRRHRTVGEEDERR
ncbi:hypothetical protein H4582DRAFT_2191820 [Lactarius indigo]|nr:hypothetical protein H4582DRAFT_2191820 [Lactarius indigo]